MPGFPFIGFASFSLSLSASVALLAALILAAAGLSVWSYRHTVPAVSRRRRVLLTTLRATALALLLFLVFEPVLNLRRTETIAPHVAVLVDDSKSLTLQDNGVARSALVQRMITDGVFDRIGRGAVVAPFRFAAHVTMMRALSADSLAFRGAETDIATSLQQVAEDLSEKNLRAVVLVTDGNVTSGKNPLYTAVGLGVPVFSVGVGDSTEKKDVLIDRVLANSVAYVGSAVPVDVTVRASGVDGGTVQVSLYDGKTLIDRKPVQLNTGAGEYRLSFSFVPNAEGVRKMRVEVTALPGEQTTLNNRRTFFIKALKSKMSIALIAGAPSPDVSFFEQVFVRDKNVAVTSYVQKLGTAWYAAAPTPRSLSEADCIVLIGYPLSPAGADVLRMVRSVLEKKNTPLLLVLSRDTDLRTLQQVLDPWLPFDVVQSRKDETQVLFEPTADGKENPITSTGIPADSWSRLPPLFRTESSFKARPGTQTLATMKISSIAFNEPVLMVRRLNRTKVIASTAYGLWRWQLAADVLGGTLPDRLLSNSIRWLTTIDEDKRVRIRPSKELFDNGEPVDFVGQVYNESYEPVDGAAVTVRVNGPGGERELVLTDQGAGRYAGSLDVPAEGDYTFTGSASRDGSEIGKDAGRFSIGETNVEFQDTRMNAAVLRQIAARTGGRFFTPSDARGLADAVLSARGVEPVREILKSDVRLWNLAWLLGAVVLLFAAEWYLRKQSGMI